MQECTTVLETRVSGIEDTLPPLVTEVKSTACKINTDVSKVENMENRLRCNHVRVVGIPEKAEGNDPIEFAECWLMDIFVKDYFLSSFAVELAHRISTQFHKPGSTPRIFLICLLNYRDKENILQRARALKDIRYNGSKIMFFPDFFPQVQKCRVHF